jgi:hypothetical protein
MRSLREYPVFVATSDADVATRAEVDAHPEYLAAIEKTGWKLVSMPNRRAVLKAPRGDLLFGGYVSRRWLKTIVVAK